MTFFPLNQWVQQGTMMIDPSLIQSPTIPSYDESEKLTVKGKIKPSRSRGKPISALWATMQNKPARTTFAEGDTVPAVGIVEILSDSAIPTTLNSIKLERKPSKKSTK